MQTWIALRRRLTGWSRPLVLALVMAFAIAVPFLSVYLAWSVLIVLPVLLLLFLLVILLD